jgi:hypothetical protein
MGEGTDGPPGGPQSDPKVVAVEAEPVGPSRKTRPVVAVVATVAAIVVIAAVVAVGVQNGHKGSNETQNAAALGLARTYGSGAVEARGGVAPMPYPNFMTPEYVLDAPLPDLGSHASVYKLDEPTIDAAYVSKLEAALDMRGTVQHFGETYVVTSNTGHLLVMGSANPYVEFDAMPSSLVPPGAIGGGNASSSEGFAPPSAIGRASGGALGVRSSGGFQPAPAKPPTSTTSTASTSSTTSTTVAGPSSDDARKVATDLLMRMGVLGDPSDWNITVAQVPTRMISSVGSCRSGATCAYPPALVPPSSAQTVTFTRSINGTTVHGLQWTVHVGHDNAVDLVNGTLGTPALLGDYPLESTSAIWADVVAGKAQLVGGMGELRLGGVRGIPTPAPTPMPPIVPQIGSNRGSATPPQTVVPTRPVVHVTGATLGLAEWGTNQGSTDVVPTYRFATRHAAGNTDEIEAVALTSDAFGPTPTTSSPPTFVPLPSPEPGQTPPGAVIPVVITVKVLTTAAAPPKDETVKILTYDMRQYRQISEKVLPIVDGATTTLLAAPPGPTALQVFGSPTNVHAEAQFRAYQGNTVRYTLVYDGTNLSLQRTDKGNAGG